MKSTGIYQIRSKVKPDKCYIGSSVNIHKRWNDHLSFLKTNKHPNPKLQNHYNKYGKNDFIFSILICCDKEDLIPTEQFFIDSYKPRFNCRERAESNLGMISPLIGRKLPEETKRKIGAANTGHKHTEEWKKQHSAFMMGKKYTLGHKQTDKWKKAHSEFMKGNKYMIGNKNAAGHVTSKEWRDNHSKLMKGRKLSLEHKINISKAKTGKSNYKLKDKPWNEKRRKAQELKKIS